MDSYKEKIISNFIENQFPQFYQEEGENFIQFVRAYYEWMEHEGPVHGDAQGGPIRESRELLEYRDIDTTVEQFLEFFQKKYLYGIPFNIISNKRFLLKHILDVYRSKGTIQCYKLLFKLIYNEDVNVYIPGNDILRVSDGKWIEPRYIEVSKTDNLYDLVGKSIVGSSSKTSAVVEKIIVEYSNKDEVHLVYISNIKPAGGDFVVGERVVDRRFISNSDIVSASPLIIGSLDELEVFNSGNGFNVGDILKIAYRDPDTNEIDSFGREGIVMIKSLFRGYGSLNFNILNGGFGFMANAEIFLYKNIMDQTGQGASFDIKLSDTKELVYNTDPLVGYLDLAINATSYGFPANLTANASSTLASALSFANGTFGKISSLVNVQTGNGYIAPANVFVRSTIKSKNLPGRIYYYNSNTFVNTYSTQVYSNTAGVNNNSILIPNANKYFDVGTYVDYIVPYTSNNVTRTVIANTAGFNAAADVIYVSNANSIWRTGDRLYYAVQLPETPISPLSGNSYYYVSFVNSSAVGLAATYGGANININDTRTAANAEIHSLTRVSTIPGLLANSRYYVKTSNTVAITLSKIAGGTAETITANPINPSETHILTTKPIRRSFYANTVSVNNTSFSIKIANANTKYYVDDLVYYEVPTGNTAIDGLIGNSYYYVQFSNSSAIALARTVGAMYPIEISTGIYIAGETHYIRNHMTVSNTPYINAYSVTISSNTDSVNNMNYSVLVPDADVVFDVNDYVYYEVPTGADPLVGLTPNTAYYIRTVNTSAFTLSATPGGSSVPVNPVLVPYDGPADRHTFRTADFLKYFTNNDLIYMQGDQSDPNTMELGVIRNVISNTCMELYGFPVNSSVPSTNNYGLAPVIMPAQFANSENYGTNTLTGIREVYSLLSSFANNQYALVSSVMRRLDNTINGINDNILALNSSGNNIVERVVAISSGVGYVEGESVHAYRYGILEVPTIIKGGRGYANGDALIFTGGYTQLPARGSVLVNGNGTITSINIASGAWFAGSGYNEVPEVIVRSTNGQGAQLTTKFIEFDTANEIRGVVRKSGIGRGQGYWETTDSLLNSDKMIQDSYYYQDYSYELKTSMTLDAYKDILYSTFHVSGSELFGKFELKPSVVGTNATIVTESSEANTNWPSWYTLDNIDVGLELSNTKIEISEYVYANNFLGIDINTIDSSNTTLHIDRVQE